MLADIELTGDERASLLKALRTAAEMYFEYAKAGKKHTVPALAEQFGRQAVQARVLARRIERAFLIVLREEVRDAD